MGSDAPRRAGRFAISSVVLLVLALSVACGGGGDDVEAGVTTAGATTATNPTPSTGTVGTPVPTAPQTGTAPPAEPVDPGRMSQGGWESVRALIADANGELRDYRTQVDERCVALLRAREVGSTVDCVTEAFDGVEDQLRETQFEMSRLRRQTGGRCRKALGTAEAIANGGLFQAARGSRAAFDSRDAAVVSNALARLDGQSERWRTASANVLRRCAPS